MTNSGRTASSRRLGVTLASWMLLMPASACAGDVSSEPEAGQTSSETPEAAGTQLHAECAGAGGPTVVFLHGLGGQGRDWAPTSNLLKGTHRCWYDRLNVGESDNDPARHSALDSVDDLHQLLPTIEAEPPYILVGHSYGGMLALMYAGTHPDEIAGMVLADSTLPFEPELDPPGTADDVKAEMDANYENLDAYAGYAAALRLETSLPDVPVTVMNGTLAELPAEWSRAAYERKLRAWVRTLDQGSLFECRCDHYMPRNIPDVVARQVRDVLSASQS